MNQIDVALAMVDSKLEEYTSATDKYVGACAVENRLRKMARTRGEYLPEWISDQLDAHVAEVHDTMMAAHAEFQAATAAWKKLAEL